MTSLPSFWAAAASSAVDCAMAGVASPKAPATRPASRARWKVRRVMFMFVSCLFIFAFGPPVGEPSRLDASDRAFQSPFDQFCFWAFFAADRSIGHGRRISASEAVAGAEHQGRRREIGRQAGAAVVALAGAAGAQRVGAAVLVGHLGVVGVEVGLLVEGELVADAIVIGVAVGRPAIVEVAVDAAHRMAIHEGNGKAQPPDVAVQAGMHGGAVLVVFALQELAVQLGELQVVGGGQVPGTALLALRGRRDDIAHALEGQIAGAEEQRSLAVGQAGADALALALRPGIAVARSAAADADIGLAVVLHAGRVGDLALEAGQGRRRVEHRVVEAAGRGARPQAEGGGTADGEGIGGAGDRVERRIVATEAQVAELLAVQADEGVAREDGNAGAVDRGRRRGALAGVADVAGVAGVLAVVDGHPGFKLEVGGQIVAETALTLEAEPAGGAHAALHAGLGALAVVADFNAAVNYAVDGQAGRHGQALALGRRVGRRLARFLGLP